MVGARRAVDLAAAAAKVRHHKVHSQRLRGAGKGLRVVAIGIALQAVEQHYQRPIGCGGSGGRGDRGLGMGKPIQVDEVAIGRIPARAPVLQGSVLLLRYRAAEQRCPNSLRVAAG